MIRPRSRRRPSRHLGRHRDRPRRTIRAGQPGAQHRRDLGLTPIVAGERDTDPGQRGARLGRRVPRVVLVGVVLVAILLGGCGLLEGPPEVLDGLSIGTDAGCGACDRSDTAANCGACDSVRTIAIRHLDETWPGHPEIGTMSFHREGWYPGENGEKILHTRSGSLIVGVFTFVDGTRHAVSVYCGVGGCR